MSTYKRLSKSLPPRTVRRIKLERAITEFVHVYGAYVVIQLLIALAFLALLKLLSDHAGDILLWGLGNY